MHDVACLWQKYILRGTIGVAIQSGNDNDKQSERKKYLIIQLIEAWWCISMA